MSRYRVVYAGYDFFSSCLDRLVNRDDIEVVLCLTGEEGDNIRNVVKACRCSNISIEFGRPTQEIMSRVRRCEPDIVVCAAYSYRLPVEGLVNVKCINIHPSLLPDGRGPNPIPYFFSGNRATSGLSIHEMTSAFDTGPILAQAPISVDETTNIESISLEMFCEAPRLLDRVLDNLETLWRQRVPQTTGSYWPLNPESDRTINAQSCTVAEAAEVIRRFSTLGVVVITDTHDRIVSHSIAVRSAEHRFVSGSVVMDGFKVKYVALRDGIIFVRPEANHD